MRHRILFIQVIILLLICPNLKAALSVSGIVTTSSTIVNGDVALSSVTVATVTVTQTLSALGATIGMKGRTLQTIISSTTAQSNTTSTSLIGIPGMSATLTLADPANYLRISLMGLLEVSEPTAMANVSIARDSTDLGQGGFITAYSYPGETSAGIRIVDFPGDTNSHTYQATFDVSVSTATASFTSNPVAYFIVEEVSH